jgi:CHAT domain-containing protein
MVWIAAIVVFLLLFLHFVQTLPLDWVTGSMVGAGLIIALGEQLQLLITDVISDRISTIPPVERTTRICVFILTLAYAAYAVWSVATLKHVESIVLVGTFLLANLNINRLVIAVLVHRMRTHVRTGNAAAAKQSSARVFDLIIIRRLSGKHRNGKREFAATALAVAGVREAVGDYRLASVLFSWALADLMEMAAHRNSLATMQSMLNAACGKARVTSFLGATESANSLETLKELARYAVGAERAADILVAGGSPAWTELARSAQTIGGAPAIDIVLMKRAQAVISDTHTGSYEEMRAAYVLAQRYVIRGENKRALKLLTQLTSKLEQSVDVRDFFFWIDCERLSAAAMIGKEEPQSALIKLNSVCDRIERRLCGLAQDGSEAELLALSDVAASVLSVSVAALSGGPVHYEAIETTLTHAIRLKGIAGLVRSSLSKALSSNLGDGLDEQAEQLRAVRQRMSVGWRSSSYTTVSAELDRLELSRIEAFLIMRRLGPDFLINSFEEDIQAVKKALSEKEVAIDCIKYGGPQSENRYGLFVLYPDARPTTFVDIGQSETLETAIKEWRVLVQLGANPSAQIGAVGVLQLQLLAPILQATAGCTTISISMDAGLWQVPLDAFLDERGRRLIETHEFFYLPSLRGILSRESFHKELTSTGGAVVFAAPDYGGGEEDRTGVSDPNEFHFDALPEAATEGRQVAGLVGAQLLIGKDATTDRLMNVRKPELLHIATHAFALDHRSSDRDKRPPTGDKRRVHEATDPLARSGLAMAGANTRPQLRGGNSNNGIFTALQVAAMDLTGTRLVALSACDTGRGDLHSGEGVLGLRGAFMIAGARTVVAAIWRIPDAQSCEWMIAFYTEIVRGQSVQSAVRRAKLRMISDYPQPLFWAGFICYGAE